MNLLKITSLLCLSVISVAATGQEYPNKPIRMVLPYGPGGGFDNAGRPMAQQMAKHLGEPIVVDNRAGANGTIGTAMVASASPDGYTIGFTGIGPLAVIPYLHKISYDPIRDLAPISFVLTNPAVLVVRPSLPVRNVAELVAYARTRPGALNYGSSGTAGPFHLAMELFNAKAGLKTTHIPYKGGADNIIGMIAGDVELGFAAVSTTLPSIRSGRLRAIAVSGTARSPQLPEVPTIAESGVTELKDYSAEVWVGLVAPAHTPRRIIQQLRSALMKVLADPDFQQKMVEQGNHIVGSTPEQFADIIKKERVKWSEIIRISGVKM